MSLLFRTREQAPREVERGVIWPGYPGVPLWATGSEAGIPVDMISSLRSAAVWACQRVIISTVAKMPVQNVTIASDGSKQLKTAPPIVRAPSGRVSQRGWVAQVLRSQLQGGNAYGDIVAWTSDYMPLQIETIAPDQVSWKQNGPDGALQPFVQGKRRNLWPNGDLWHLPVSQFLLPGTPVAMSPTEYARTAIGTSIAAEEFGAHYFRDGAAPSVVAQSDRNLTDTQASEVKQAIIRAMRGNREPAVLGSGWTLKEFVADPKNGQFIELLQFEVEQACRFWGVPPTMVYAAVSGQNVTYANVSQGDLQFLKHSVDSWIIDLEDAWSSLYRPMNSVVKFDTDEILRMDALARMELWRVKLGFKGATVNEFRRDDNEPPFADPEFDKPGIPGLPVDAPPPPLQPKASSVTSSLSAS